MATFDDAVKAVVDAVDALEAVTKESAPVDSLRTVVETQLISEGWTAPVPVAEVTVEAAPVEPTE